MSEVHPTAVIADGAQIGAGCQIGPYCIIDAHVHLGENCRLHSHVVIDGHIVVGDDNHFFPFTSIGLQSQDLKYAGGTTHTSIGERNTFREFTTVHSATSDGDTTRIGDDNHFLAYTHVAHDCRLGSHIIMSNVATLAGHVTVEDRAIIGGLAAVHQFCRIGTMSIIGGCSKVVQDIPPFMMADGNPAATRAPNREGLRRNDVSSETQAALKQAYRILFREGHNFTDGIEKVRAEVSTSDEIEHLLQFIKSSQRGIAR